MEEVGKPSGVEYSQRATEQESGAGFAMFWISRSLSCSR